MHASRTQSPAVGSAYLLVSAVSSTLVYCAIFLRLPLLQTYTSQLKNLNQIPASEWPIGVAVIACIALLFGAYALGAQTVAACWHQRMIPRLVLMYPLFFALLLLFVFPMTSTDLYDYLFRGWISAHYGKNPFLAPPAAFPNDPLLPFVGWKHVVTAYGPLWERVSWLLAWLVGDLPGANSAPPLLLRLLLGYKVLNLLGYALCGAAIWGALRSASAGARWLGLYLWLWNPLVLWETIAAGHNDVWMALPVILALWALRVKTRQLYSGHEAAPVLSLIALTAGGLVKFVAFFFGPVALAAMMRNTPSWWSRLRLVLIGGAACLGLALFAYAPFWAGAETLRNVGDRRTLYNVSWLSALRYALDPTLGGDQAQNVAAMCSLVLLLAGIGWATWRAWRAPDEVSAHMLWLALWFMFVANPWFQPWYLVWVVALAAVQPMRHHIQVAVGLFCATALASYIVGGLVLPALGLSQPMLVRELLVSLFVYLPPLLVLAWAARRPARAPAYDHMDQVVPIMSNTSGGKVS